MPIAALALLLIAAAGHAGWNLLVKQARERQVFTAISVAIAPLLLVPSWLSGRPFPATLWPKVLGSAFCEVVYFALLVAMYQASDFSLAYPIARGAAPLFLVVWSAIFLGQIPRPGGFVGLAILAVGLFIVGSAGAVPWTALLTPAGAKNPVAQPEAARPAPSSPRSVGGLGRGICLSLAAALCISAYTAIDGAAMGSLPRISTPGQPSPASYVAAPYLAAVLGLSALIITPAVFWRHGWAAFAREWRSNWWKALLVACGMALSYQLVLLAFKLAPVAYVGAVREVSVVFGAVAGWKLLGERLGATRAVGSVVILAGVLCIWALG
jgi:drug/metabolite transporter (DMT)-like permease